MAKSESHISGQSWWTEIWAAYRAVLPSVLRHPATWLFVAICLLAALVYLPIGGNLSLLLVHLIIFGIILIILLLILPLTGGAPAPAWEGEPAYSRSRLWWQVAALLFFWVLFIVYAFVLFFLLAPLIRTTPGDSGGRLFVTLGTGVVNLLLLAVLPLAVVRLLGAGWRELGWGRGYHMGRVIAVTCFVPLCLIIAFIIMGRVTVLAWLTNLLSGALRAGFPEEVFFRGLLQTRLTRLAGTGWGIVLSTFIFGLIHLATNMVGLGGGFPLALAEAVVGQMGLGLAFAVIFQRTRSILPGVVFHSLLLSMGV